MRLLFVRNERAARIERAGMALAIVLILALLAMLLLGGRAALAGETARPRLFNAAETAHHEVHLFPKWAGMLARHAAEQAAERAAEQGAGPSADAAPCAGGDCAVARWRSFLAGLAGKDPVRQLEAVQAYLNRVPYRSDREAYGVADYWATPREFLTRGGDCEDYAIAKFLSLRRLGWPAEDLRVVVVEDARRGALHAVLVAFHGGTAYVLDNLRPAIAEHGTVGEYRPIYSITEHRWFYHGTEALAAAAPVTEPAATALAEGR